MLSGREVCATGRLLFQRSPAECGVCECDIVTSAVMRLMPRELSSHERGNVDMQLRNIRHVVARIIKTETSVYRLIQCIQICVDYLMFV